MPHFSGVRLTEAVRNESGSEKSCISGFHSNKYNN
ncbi:hypothetical protein T01_14317 [Trichinella spiralis]|uniref:Uncharacterized protein n=1 Tax=Trichinella spiralis TaxID=6334 RepID=A0A0V0YX66_TRISP|nr:hypothetical protein T01_14317 [Trichinella spiralis]